MEKILMFLLFSQGVGLENSLNEILHKNFDKSLSDLGYSPKTYWSRYPHNPPMKLFYFDDLFREPLSIITFTEGMANACSLYLIEKQEENFLYQLLYFLGIDRKISGFRNYGANLKDYPEMTFKEAMSNLQEKLFSQPNKLSFGGEYEEDDTPTEIPEDYGSIIANMLMHIADAYSWWKIAMRNVPEGMLYRILQYQDVDETQAGGNVFYPELDDLYNLIDFHSLFYAALKITYASGILEKKFNSLKKENEVFNVEIETPYGRIAISSGENNIYNGNYLLIVDFKGDDTYKGRYASGTAFSPVSVVIDLSGNDRYETGLFGSQGAGIGGVGLLFDADGNDVYRAEKGAQGFGLYGVGILYDRKGTDTFNAQTMAQGSGFFNGIGLLIENNGDDSYYLYGTGQGNGEMGGVGVLADASGNDTYKAEPESKVYDRGDYHSDYKINVSAGQGYGGGRRGDGSDGHSYAGGLGALLDLEGNDKYISGNFSQGTGYWFGIGVLYDREGDDLYKSCYFTQASAAHYAIGVLIDENGDDRHELFETAGAGLSFGWDFGVTLLLDKSGSDFYSAKKLSIGVSQIRSNSLFLELSGNDTYRITANTLKLGVSDFQKHYKIPNPTSPYLHWAKSFGIFIDSGGKDKYEVEGEKKFSDNTVWFQPHKSDTTYGFENYGIGIDREKVEP